MFQSIISVIVFSFSSETFPSGCLTLDFALGGGLPKGRIVEVIYLQFLLFCTSFWCFFMHVAYEMKGVENG